MDAKVTWKGRMSFTGTADTGFTVPLGSDPSVGGENDGFGSLRSWQSAYPAARRWM